MPKGFWPIGIERVWFVGWPVSRVLFRALRRGNGHFSSPPVARWIEQPTRES